jgi:hypothetical protein
MTDGQDRNCPPLLRACCSVQCAQKSARTFQRLKVLQGGVALGCHLTHSQAGAAGPPSTPCNLVAQQRGAAAGADRAQLIMNASLAHALSQAC